MCAALADDAYFAICQPGAHRHARECLHTLQPAAARAAAAAAKVERAARGARGLVERGLSLASSPADALATADPAALDARRRELATCLPALLLEGEPTLHPRLLQLLVSLCAASGAATHAAATQPLLLGCLAHPWPAVRETLLAQLLAALSRADAAAGGAIFASTSSDITRVSRVCVCVSRLAQARCAREAAVCSRQAAPPVLVTNAAGCGRRATPAGRPLPDAGVAEVARSGRWHGTGETRRSPTMTTTT